MPEKYKLPKNPEKFSETLNFACAKLFVDNQISYTAKLALPEDEEQQSDDQQPKEVRQPDDQYDIKIKVKNLEIYIDFANNLDFMISDDLMQETSSAKTKDKIIYYCDVAKQLAESKNYFLLKVVLDSLVRYTGIIKKQKVNNKFQDVSNYNDIYNALLEQRKLIEKLPSVKYGLKQASDVDDLMFPHIGPTRGTLDKYKEKSRLDSKTDQQKSKGLVRYKQDVSGTLGALNICRKRIASKYKPNLSEEKKTAILYMKLISRPPDYENSTVKKASEVGDHIYAHRHSITSRSNKVGAPSTTLWSIKRKLNSINKSVNKPLKKSSNSEPLDLLDLQEVNKERPITKYISHVLKIGQSNEDDSEVDLFAPYINQIMLDYNLTPNDDPEKFLEIFESYAEMDLLYHGSDYKQDDFDKWGVKLQELKEIAKNNYPEIPLNDNTKQYARMLILALNKQYEINEFPKQYKTQKALKKLIESQNLNLPITSSPESFIKMINNKLLEFELGSDEHQLYKEGIRYFNKSYAEYNNHTTKVLIDSSIRAYKKNSTTKNSDDYQPTTVHQGFVMQNNPLAKHKISNQDLNGICVDNDSEYGESLDIEEQLTEILEDLDGINGFTQLAEQENCYQSTIEYDDNDEITILVDKSGQEAYIQNDFNEKDYKRLVDIFIRTNDVTDPNIIKPLNITGQDRVRALEIISQSIDEYKDVKDIDNSLGLSLH